MKENKVGKGIEWLESDLNEVMGICERKVFLVVLVKSIGFREE